MHTTFTPEDEPYLGRQALHRLDRVVVLSLLRNEELAQKSRDTDLTDMQLVACQIVPQTLKLGLAQRELVRQGYLFAARVLTRSLLERVVILLYLESNPDDISVWKAGWKHPERPSLRAMLKRIGNQHMPFLNSYTDLVNEHNSLTHGDPASALYNLTWTDDGEPVFGISKDLNNPKACDRICEEVSLWLGHVMLAAGRIMGVHWR